MLGASVEGGISLVLAGAASHDVAGASSDGRARRVRV